MPTCSRSNQSAAIVALVILAIASGCRPERVASPGADAEAAHALKATLVSASSGAGAAAPAAATGTGWGSLTGRFVFAGAPGTPKPLIADKDTEVCSKAGMRR